MAVRIHANRPPGYAQRAILIAGIAAPLVLGLLIPEVWSQGIPWTLIGVAVAFGLIAAPEVLTACWSRWGIETISARDGSLVVEKKLFGRTRSRRSFPLAEVRDISLSPIPDRWARWTFLGLGDLQRGYGLGPVAFEFKGETVRVAEGLRQDIPAAEQLVEMIRHAQENAMPASRGCVDQALPADAPSVD